MSAKVYQIVTDKVLEMMNKGMVPWRRPWVGSNRPRNAITNRPYSGGNLFLLSCLGYADPRFLTYKQAQAAGGHVRKGEKSFPVFFWTFLEKVNPKGVKERIPMFRCFSVFNIEQCDDVKLPKRDEDERFDHDPIEAAAGIIDHMPQRPAIREVNGGGRACYSPSKDEVTVPHVSQFPKVEEYYCTMFHELAHSTGHASRLNREGVTNPVYFGSHEYSREELIAEMTAAYLCAESGIENETLENSAAYLKGWYAKIQNDPTLFWKAASAAQKAADFITGRKAAEAAAVAESEAEAA